jgi:BirA family biotin operon repressor/biotin-[acetyl-CoA-carboxylase] ligase
MDSAPLDEALALRALRLLGDGELHSAASLARALGCSHAALSSALRKVQRLRAAAVQVESRSYRLAVPIDWLEVSRIRSHLGAHGAHLDVRVVDIMDSTNTVLLEQALAGAPSGIALFAELQTAGRGRRGRSWHAGLGSGLTFSLLWRFEQGPGALSGLSLAVGVALVRALRAVGVEQARLKWPNDVLWDHRKLAGVLIEVQGEILGPSAAVIGWGINVCLDEATREQVDQAVTDVVAAGGPADRNRLAGVVLAHLSEVLDAFARCGFAGLRTEWESYHVLAGKGVALTLADGTRERGVVAGVADDGALLVQRPDGLRRFYSGEVSLRPLQAPRHSDSGATRGSA